MTAKTRNIILGIVLLQLLIVIGLLGLPHLVRAMPGTYYVRLQNHSITAPIIALVTTPLPTALPVAVTANESSPINIEQLAEIPGLEETIVPRETATVVPPTPTLDAVRETAVPQAAASPTPTPTVSPPPSSANIPNLIHVQQSFNNCGPANLTIVLDHFGEDVTQEDVAAYLKPNREDRNVSPWQLNDYVNNFTSLRSTAHSGGDVETVKRLIAKGFPVVIEKGYKPNSTEGWYGHYLTVYGYDDEKEEFYTRDTYLGPSDGSPRILTYDEFAHWWQQFNYTFFVVYPPDREDVVLSTIATTLQDPITMWQYTIDLARKEIAANPENVFAWFNLGVSLTRLGENTGEAAYYEEAANTFDKARELGLPPRTLYYEHRPLMAYYKVGRVDEIIELTDALLQTIGGPWVEEIHWYRGHALAAQGKLTAARGAYEEALKVNENFYYAQTSIDWIDSELNK